MKLTVQRQMTHAHWHAKLRRSLAMAPQRPSRGLQSLERLLARVEAAAPNTVGDWHIDQTLQVIGIVQSHARDHRRSADTMLRVAERQEQQLSYYRRGFVAACATAALELASAGDRHAAIRALRRAEPAAAALRPQEKLFRKAERVVHALSSGSPNPPGTLRRDPMKRAPSARNKPEKEQAAAVDAYLASLPAEKRGPLQRLRRAIRAAAPRAEEGFSYALPAFRINGRPLAAYGAAAKHCSFFPMSPAVIRAHAAALKGYDTSKGTIRFSAENPLPLALVRKLIKARLAELEPRPTQPMARRNPRTRTR